MRWSLFSAAAVLVVAASMAGAAPAFAEPSLPTYVGLTAFPSINGPDGPEEFSWEVTLSNEQELLQVDDQHAEVVYVETGGVTAFVIAAERAHDAVGSDVPTSLTVSGEKVITLTVHHRAGNPVTEGAPFTYPISPGAGWEGGFSTVQVFGPPPQITPPPENLPPEKSESASVPTGCVVPALVGKSLKADRKRLRRAGCRLGRVWGKKSKEATVVQQHPQPGELLAPGTGISVILSQPRSTTKAVSRIGIGPNN